jgi:hypothetical protein
MAVRIFQQIHSIPDTGVVNQQTWTKLVTVWQSRTQGGINSSFTPSGGAAPTPDPTPVPRPTPDPTPTYSQGPIDIDINALIHFAMVPIMEFVSLIGVSLDKKPITGGFSILGCGISFSISMELATDGAIQFSSEGFNATASNENLFGGVDFSFAGLSHGIFYGFTTFNAILFQCTYRGNWYQSILKYTFIYKTNYGVNVIFELSITLNRFVVATAGVAVAVAPFVIASAPALDQIMTIINTWGKNPGLVH